MPALTCNACNKEFEDDVQQKAHYRSEWHRYNLKRKVAGVPGVTETLFQAKLAALSEQKNKLNDTPLMYGCGICGKEYKSSKAHAQHLKSRSHIMRASKESNSSSESTAVIKPAPRRQASRPSILNKPQTLREIENEESEDEWEEVDPNSVDGLSNVMDTVEGSDSCNDEDGMIDSAEELDPASCFICDLNHDSVEGCMVHMHKEHGFFIPDIEYLKDPKGFLTYVGLKVKRYFTCLYCNERCHPFQSLEAVRKHMIAKGHCKVHYGDGGEEEEADLEEFYDYSSSYADGNGEELVSLDGIENNIELGAGGAELIITKKSERGVSTVTLGSREFLRYYKQKPRPSPTRDIALAVSLASRYRSMGLATVQSKEPVVRMKVFKAMNRSGVEAMRSKIGMKSNVIRNLPRNAPH